MTHLPFIAASYALGVLLPGAYAVAAFLRMRAASRRLAAVDTRRADRRGGPPWGGMTRKRRRLYALLACGIGLGSATALALTAFQSSLVFFISPSEIVAGDRLPGRTFRLGGLVQAGKRAARGCRRPAGGAVPPHRRQRDGGGDL